MGAYGCHTRRRSRSTRSSGPPIPIVDGTTTVPAYLTSARSTQSGSRTIHPVQPVAPFFLFGGARGFGKKWAAWLQRRVPAQTRFVPYQQVDDLGAYGLTEDYVVTAA